MFQARAPRVQHDTRVRVRLEENQETVAQAVDVSWSGMLVHLDAQLEVGREVELEFLLPGQVQPMKIGGVVARCEGGFHGVRFVGLPDEVRCELREFIIDRYLQQAS